MVQKNEQLVILKGTLHEGINQKCSFCKKPHADMAQLISETASNDVQLF